MSKPFTVLGDKTDHGGTVVSAAPTSLTGGKPIARIGDKVPCPRCQKPNAVIVGPGDPTVIVDGAPLSLHGDKTSCGATLIASQMVTTAGGPGGGSNMASASNSKTQAARLKPADLARQSGAQTFDELPPQAKLYVYDQAERAGIFQDDEAFATAGLEAANHETLGNGVQKYTTEKPEVAARAVRAQMGLGPYKNLSPDQIMDTDPGAPEYIVGGSKAYDKHVAQVDVKGGSWLARFADTRPVEGIAKPAYAPGALPKASAAGEGVATAGTGFRTMANVVNKGIKADEDGLKQRIDIYEAPGGKKMVHMTNWTINQATGENEPTTLTRTQVSEALNDPSFKGLDEHMKQIQKDKLNDFYRSHFGD